MALFCLLALLPLSVVRAEDSSSQNFSLQSAGLGPLSVVALTSLGPPEVVNAGPVVSYLADTSARITWVTSQPANSIVDYGTTSAFGAESGDYTTLATDHTVNLPGLLPQTKYYYQVKSINSEGLIGASAISTFITLAQSGITGITLSDINYDSALVSWQTGNATHSQVQYGQTLSYGSEVDDTSLSYTTDHAVKLSSLKAGTTYHLRVLATDSAGATSNSTDLSFVTHPNPEVTSLVATPTSPHDVTITWTTNTPASGILQYRQSGMSREISLGASDLKTEQSIDVSDLLDSTTYIMGVTITDDNGKQATLDNQSFTMPQDKAPPLISDLKVTDTRSGTDVVMTATWTTSKLAVGTGSLKPKSQSGDGAPTLPEPAPVVSHILVQTGLNPSTLYVLHVTSTDGESNISQANISFFTPQVDKGIFSLIAASIASTFGWTSHIFGK